MIAYGLGVIVHVTRRDGAVNTEVVPVDQAAALAERIRARPDLYAEIVLGAVYQRETLREAAG
jgi:hypothetical protein